MYHYHKKVTVHISQRQLRAVNMDFSPKGVPSAKKFFLDILFANLGKFGSLQWQVTNFCLKRAAQFDCPLTTARDYKDPLLRPCAIAFT